MVFDLKKDEDWVFGDGFVKLESTASGHSNEVFLSQLEVVQLQGSS